MNDLLKRISIMSGMIKMCERIHFGSDSALLDECAIEIERLNYKLYEVKQLLMFKQDNLKLESAENVNLRCQIEKLRAELIEAKRRQE